MTFTRAEIVVMMRSLLRSLEKTPERERAAHHDLFGKLSAEVVRLTPHKRRLAVARAIDHLNGE
jgi:hypothetical protein